MSCAVFLRHRLVAPHLHFILSPLCIITSLCVWEFALQSCQLQVPPAHLLYLKKPGASSSAGTFALLCGARLWGSEQGVPCQGSASSAVLQCSARKEPGRNPVLWPDREKAQGQSDTSPKSWLRAGACPLKGDVGTWRLDVWRAKLLNGHGQH